MLSNKNIALIVLVVCLSGTFCAYHFQDYFIGGLFYHGFLAASIGGLADWYAVTALFRKPFGCIRWRTEVIPRKKEYIMNELSYFVCNDLLSTENIMENLALVFQKRQQTFSGILLKYLFEENGLEELKGLSVPLLTNAINEANKSDILILTKIKSYQAIMELEIASAGIHILEKAIKDSATQKLEEQLLVELKKIIGKQEFSKLVDDLLKNAWEKYRSGGRLRNMAMRISNIDVASFTPKIVDAAKKYLENVKMDPNHATRVFVRNLITDKLEQLAGNKAVLTFINQKLAQLTGKEVELVSGKLLQADEEQINAAIDVYAHRFQANQQWQSTMDNFLGKAVENFLVAKHQCIESLVKDKLKKYNTDEVVALIEDRVGNDLQMIRVNGSVVGGLTGMVLYLISQLVEGVL